MKRIALLFVLFMGVNCCFANEELSKQATAFYSDNNHHKTMDLLLQIDEKERTPQDWLLLGNLLDEKVKKTTQFSCTKNPLILIKSITKHTITLLTYTLQMSVITWQLNTTKSHFLKQRKSICFLQFRLCLSKTWRN